MKELEKFLISTNIDDLLDIDYTQYDAVERNYLLQRITEIADEKCYQVGIEYNIHDVELVDRLDNKLKLIDLALTLAYDSKTNFEDVFSQIRMWDAIIHAHLKRDNVVIPPSVMHTKDEAFGGAYVKEPVPGLYNFPISLDLDSLYPHLILMWNISPEVFIEPSEYSDDMRQTIAAGVSVEKLLYQEIDLSFMVDEGVTLTPNGQFFDTKKRGFLPVLMERFYTARKEYKNKSIAAKKELSLVREEIKRRKTSGV